MRSASECWLDALTGEVAVADAAGCFRAKDAAVRAAQVGAVKALLDLRARVAVRRKLLYL